MADRLDYELHAIEADTYAESACRVSIAHSWRDIAGGYRMLSDFIADAQAADQRRDAKGSVLGRSGHADKLTEEVHDAAMARRDALRLVNEQVSEDDDAAAPLKGAVSP